MTKRLLRDLELGQLPSTPFLAVGHSRRLPPLPNLAPARFTLADQRADLSAPRTRLVKDVLRVGRWKVGQDERGQPVWWEVTRDTLRSIAREFSLAQSRGVAQNLVWGHGDPLTRIVDPRDLIAPLDQVFVEGDTLWVSAYVTPEQARDLRNPARKVSVRVMENWSDGAGRHYPIMLLHVAVVDQPVLAGQGPFVDLANPSHSLLPEGTSMPLDYQRTFDAVNVLLELQGLELPETTTEENFNDTLDTLVATLQGEKVDAPDKDPDVVIEGEPAADEDAQLGLRVEALGRRVKDLALQLRQLRSQRGRSAYVARVKDLALRGHLSAREVQQFTRLGARHGWDLALLDVAESRHSIDLTRYARRTATSSPPAVRGVVPTLTEAEIQAGVKALDGRAS